MSVPSGYRYTREHEWLKVEPGNRARVGITDYAQTELGDVVFAELPASGSAAQRGKAFSSVESVKAVSDVYSPVDGKVLEVNTSLGDSPELLNQHPYSEGWMALIEMTDPKQADALMDSEAYEAYLSEIAK